MSSTYEFIKSGKAVTSRKKALASSKYYLKAKQFLQKTRNNPNKNARLDSKTLNYDKIKETDDIQYIEFQKTFNHKTTLETLDALSVLCETIKSTLDHFNKEILPVINESKQFVSQAALPHLHHDEIALECGKRFANWSEKEDLTLEFIKEAKALSKLLIKARDISKALIQD